MNKNLFTILILLSAIIVGGAIILTNYKDKILPPKPEKPEEKAPEFNIRPVSDSDHILGNPGASAILIEYSDFTCQYCKQFHTTMSTLMRDFGKTGELAWVYRHFPIEGENSDSYKAAIASECVAKISGNSVFWEFVSLIFAGSPDTVKADKLEEIANTLKVPMDQYKSCLLDNFGKEKILAEIEDGKKLFETDPNFGTPYNILITKNGLIRISGSQPLEILRELIRQNI